MVGLLQHHILHLHQAGLGAALVFVQLHGDIADLLLRFGDHHMFQRVHAAAGLFNFGSHQLAAFFHLGQAKKIRQKVCKALHGIVQIGAGKGKAIGINVGRVAGAGLIPEHRHIHAHHVAAVGFQQHLLLGGHHGGVQLFVAHAGAG